MKQRLLWCLSGSPTRGRYIPKPGEYEPSWSTYSSVSILDSIGFHLWMLCWIIAFKYQDVITQPNENLYYIDPLQGTIIVMLEKRNIIDSNIRTGWGYVIFFQEGNPNHPLFSTSKIKIVRPWPNMASLNPQGSVAAPKICFTESTKLMVPWCSWFKHNSFFVSLDLNIIAFSSPFSSWRTYQ